MFLEKFATQYYLAAFHRNEPSNIAEPHGAIRLRSIKHLVPRQHAAPRMRSHPPENYIENALRNSRSLNLNVKPVLDVN